MNTKQKQKPSEVSCYVDECPICGKEGKGVEYKASDPYWAEKYYVEFVVNHSINEQTKGIKKDTSRNDFCYTGHLRKTDPEERDYTWRATPKDPPNWPFIKEELRKKKGRQTTL